ncbi:3'-5' exoribonuclease [Leeia sp. TBRC 13508]|uniref:3'-5' exoribonuclease n=1 Tax=Leeia speluncae TaxID=2884804 RepID=A0ABS8D7R8_9NEIS|nr:3'-5' exonuclease [Leeia speluncae]MCB6184254.1 3'-5' exoribonuclease [Leeia speluncae]
MLNLLPLWKFIFPTFKPLKKLTKAMIDIETAGKAPGCIVLTMAAVLFDQNGKISETLELAISYDESSSVGLTCDANTQAWWHTQAAETFRLVWEPEHVTAGKEAFEKLFEFCQSADEVWSKGSDFDFPIIKAAAQAFGSDTSLMWDYWKQRDLRTMIKLLPHVTHTKTNIAHTALGDAIDQTKHLQKLLAELKKLTPSNLLHSLFR